MPKKSKKNNQNKKLLALALAIFAIFGIVSFLKYPFRVINFASQFVNCSHYDARSYRIPKELADKEIFFDLSDRSEYSNDLVAVKYESLDGLCGKSDKNTDGRLSVTNIDPESPYQNPYDPKYNNRSKLISSQDKFILQKVILEKCKFPLLCIDSYQERTKFVFEDQNGKTWITSLYTIANRKSKNDYYFYVFWDNNGEIERLNLSDYFDIN